MSDKFGAHAECTARVQQITYLGGDEQNVRIDELEATNETLRETVAQQADRIDNLEDEIGWTTEQLFQLEDTVCEVSAVPSNALAKSIVHRELIPIRWGLRLLGQVRYLGGHMRVTCRESRFVERS